MQRPAEPRELTILRYGSRRRSRVYTIVIKSKDSVEQVHQDKLNYMSETGRDSMDDFCLSQGQSAISFVRLLFVHERYRPVETRCCTHVVRRRKSEKKPKLRLGGG